MHVGGKYFKIWKILLIPLKHRSIYCYLFILDNNVYVITMKYIKSAVFIWIVFDM